MRRFLSASRAIGIFCRVPSTDETLRGFLGPLWPHERRDFYVSTALTFVFRGKRDVADAPGVHHRWHIVQPEPAAVGGDRSRTAHHHASVARRPGDRTSRNRASLVNAGWVVLGMGIAVAVLMLATSRLRRDHDLDLGTVSHHWIAEQRMGPGHDLHR